MFWKNIKKELKNGPFLTKNSKKKAENDQKTPFFSVFFSIFKNHDVLIYPNFNKIEFTKISIILGIFWVFFMFFILIFYKKYKNKRLKNCHEWHFFIQKVFPTDSVYEIKIFDFIYPYNFFKKVITVYCLYLSMLYSIKEVCIFVIKYTL